MFRIARSSLVSCLVVASSLLAGCTADHGDDAVVGAKLEVVERSRSTLSVSGISAINGSYGASCKGRSGGDAWSVGVDPSATLAHDALTVRKNDVDCVLTLTEIVADGATYAAADAIALDASYGATPSAFGGSSSSSADFFANARLDSLSFAADFTISLSVATKASDVETGEKKSEYATHSASVSVADVPPPSYAINLGDFALQTDANDSVVSSSGHAQLTAGSTIGQSYAIYEGTLTGSSTPSALADAMSNAAVSGPLSGLPSLQIPHADFDLVGKSLSTSIVRTVIIRNVDESSNVASYQLIAVTFSKP